MQTFLVLFTLLFTLFLTDAQIVSSQTDCPFKLVEGNFQVGDGQLLNLLDKDIKLNVHLGDKYKFRVLFKVRSDVHNPCLEKEEPCIFVDRVIFKDKSGEEKIINSGSSFEFFSDDSFGIIDSETIVKSFWPQDELFFVISVIKNGQHIMRYEWPLEVR